MRTVGGLNIQHQPTFSGCREIGNDRKERERQEWERITLNKYRGKKLYKTEILSPILGSYYPAGHLTSQKVNFEFSL